MITIVMIAGGDMYVVLAAHAEEREGQVRENDES